jgi:hypothetical protein
LNREDCKPDLPVSKRTLGLSDIFDLLMHNIKLLMIGVVGTGIIAFGAASFWPKSYTSVTYLNLDAAAARAADAVMSSYPVLDKVMSDFQVPGADVEARRRFLNSSRRIVVAENEAQRTSKLFRLEIISRDPKKAQELAKIFVKYWLEATKPPPNQRMAIEADIRNADLQMESITKLVERVQKDAPSLVLPNSAQGEIASSLVSLGARREEYRLRIENLREKLAGLSSDVIFGLPSLPEEASGPKRGIITILASASAAIALAIFVVWRGFSRLSC